MCRVRGVVGKVRSMLAWLSVWLLPAKAAWTLTLPSAVPKRARDARTEVSVLVVGVGNRDTLSSEKQKHSSPKLAEAVAWTFWIAGQRKREP
jgi:hypothetical protein